MISKRRLDPIYLSAPLGALFLLFLGCMLFNPANANPPIEPPAKSNSKKQDSILLDIVRGHDPAVSIEKHKKWRASLPQCAPGKTALLEDWPETGEVRGLRGVLAPGMWMCTLAMCPDSPCCNFCSCELRFIPKAEFDKRGAKGKGKPIQLARATLPMRYSAIDCAVDSLKKLPYLDVVVSGKTGEAGALINADLCVMGEAPGPSETIRSRKVR